MKRLAYNYVVTPGANPMINFIVDLSHSDLSTFISKLDHFMGKDNKTVQLTKIYNLQQNVSHNQLLEPAFKLSMQFLTFCKLDRSIIGCTLFHSNKTTKFTKDE